MKVNELRSALETRGLNTKGLKSQLAARLQEALDQDEDDDEDNEKTINIDVSASDRPIPRVTRNRLNSSTAINNVMI